MSEKKGEHPVINDFLLWLGLDAWRPALSALLLPPVPFIVITFIGARWFARMRWRAWGMVMLGLLGTWFSCTNAVSQGLHYWLMPPTRALTTNEVADLRRAPKTAIVILGGGRRETAPEYGVSELNPVGLERLRYGLWLGTQTGLPVMFSGGLGHGGKPGQSEAEIASRTAERDFGRKLTWLEDQSRDTRENALRSVPLLRAQGIERIVLVTHAFHMARARANFERAAKAAGGAPMQIINAPMGLRPWFQPRVDDFLPSREGYAFTTLTLREFFGRLIGA
jgi:uncharacterized SAM-binding protein YcdF (DUF218 family)